MFFGDLLIMMFIVQVSSQAGARIRRPKVGSTMKRATRMRRVVKSIDSQLSDMGHFSKRSLAKTFVVFTLFTFTSQGVSELRERFGQLSDVLGSLNKKWGLQEGDETEGWIELVGIMGEDYGWLFK